MRELKITDLYENADEQKIADFTEKMNSEMKVKTEYYKDNDDFKWINVLEELLPYVEKILRNPKRFITTEEEIVKIESAKRIGVETVQHLAKHTNYIQDVDDKSGDVLPSKLLNVFKEETYDTYENRFIYTLVNFLQDFINEKKRNIKKNPKLKDNKRIQYNSSTFIGQERINVNIQLNTDLDTNIEFNQKYSERIKQLENSIRIMQDTEVYRELQKAQVPFVTEPIRKTNVILKNVNFQYAMKLWTYIRENMGKNEAKKLKREYMERGTIKKLIDETFLLEYLTVNTINNDEELTQITKDKTISRMLDRILDMNPELTKKELQKKLGVAFDKAKQRRKATKIDIEKIFRKHIDKYLEGVNV